jgi:hypothetical protein
MAVLYSRNMWLFIFAVIKVLCFEVLSSYCCARHSVVWVVLYRVLTVSVYGSAIPGDDCIRIRYSKVVHGEERDGSRHVVLLAIQPADAADSPKII